MAIEKMVMMNVIGDISYVDNVLKDLILLEEVDLISALSQIEENSFVFNVQDKNLEKAIDLNYISPFPKDRSYEELLEKGKKLKQMLDIEDEKSTEKLKEKLDFPSISLELNNIYEEVKGPYEQLKLFKEELVKADKLYDNFSLLKNINIPIEELRDLSYFDFRFGILSKEDQIKLKKNYNNILAIVLHTGNSKEGEVYLVMYPSSLREELSRVLRSLNFKGILIPEEYTKTPMEMLEFLESKKVQLKDKIDILGRTLLELKNKYEVKVQELINGLCMKERIEDCKEYMASSKKFFYLSGWVSKKSINKVEKVLNKYEGILTMYKEKDEVIGFIPPTKLKNIKLFKPFEYLVKMYGIPSYNEIDPTSFFSISYMFLFGAMFGDLGQGFVLLLGGIILAKAKGNKILGGLLLRLGLSSMIFGTLYGAVFGFEDIIPALLMRPFENINKVLAGAVVIGIVLILISYIFGIVNKLKRKDIEEGIFGKDGLVGLLFYICLLTLIGGKLLGKTILPMETGVVIILLSIALMIFKEPLSNLIMGKKPLYNEDISGYYIEGVFSIIETLLSMLSGTVSFIRVGAFALTHVGLFIAFQTIGELIGTTAGNIIVLILGNIIIIGLEGLIVFIQGLRLQYYELFSRYYKGEGKEFNPINIK
jgi:V/A-type H+-transporting ATPase subunit I